MLPCDLLHEHAFETLMRCITIHREQFRVSDMITTGAEDNLFFNSLKLASQSSVHLNSAPFSNSSIIDFAILEKLSMNRQ